MAIRDLLPNAPETEANRGRRLTPRQVQVAELAVSGKSNVDIGELLGISPETAKRHLFEIFTKVGATSRSMLASLWLAELLAAKEERIDALRRKVRVEQQRCRRLEAQVRTLSARPEAG